MYFLFALEKPFIDLNINVICTDVHISVDDKRDDFGFPIVKFFWLGSDAPRLPSYGILWYPFSLSQFLKFFKILDFQYKNAHFKTIDTGIQI